MMAPVQFLSGWIVRSSILILVGAALLSFVRVKSPSIRLAAWTAMLLGSFAIPFLSAVLPKVPIEVSLASAPPRGAPGPPPPASALPFDWMRLAVILYLLTAGVLMLRLLLAVALSNRIFRRSSPARLDDVEGTGVRESGHIASPVTIGVFRPAVLLPLEWHEWDPAKLKAVLAHERSHIRRFDPALQFLSAIHRALLWATPLSWFLHRAIVRTAEEVSDGDAIATTGDCVSYAEILLGLMQRGSGQTRWLGVPMALYDRPERRIRRILNSAPVTSRLTRRSIAAIVVLGAPLALLAAAAQTQSSPKPASVAEEDEVAASEFRLSAAIASPSGSLVEGLRLRRIQASGLSTESLHELHAVMPVQIGTLLSGELIASTESLARQRGIAVGWIRYNDEQAGLLVDSPK